MTDEYNRLEYRPHIEYTPEKHEGMWSETPEPEEDYISTVIEQEFSNDMWNGYNEVLEVLVGLSNYIRDVMKDVTTKVNIREHVLENVKARHEDGSPSGEMSFDLYEKLLNNTDGLSRAVVNAYENAHSRLEGSVEVELYPIIKDLIDEVEGVRRFMKRTILNVANADINGEVGNVSQAVLDKVREQEFQRFALLKKLHAKRDKLRDTSENLDENPEYTKIIEDLRFLVDTEKTVWQLKDIVNYKAGVFGKHISDIASLLYAKEEDYFQGYRDEIPNQLSVGHRGSAAESLKSYGSLLKLSCDAKTKANNIARNRLSETIARETRHNTEDALTVLFHYRREVIASAVDWLARSGDEGFNLIDPDASEIPYAFIEIGDIISEGAMYGEEQYQTALQAYDNVTRTAEQLRDTSVHTLREKERVRKLNDIISKLL